MSDIAPANEPTNVEKIRGLRWSLAETVANMVFVQLTFFGSVFILFLNELQLNNSQIGLVLSFFPFFGLIAVFISPWVARFGYKRTFLLFWTLRKIVTALLLLVPWILMQFGSQATLIFVGLIVISFGLFRAIAEVGYYPWNQEFIPTSIRGRYAAVTNFLTNIVGIITIFVASYVIENLTGLNRFTILFAIGVVFGLAGAWFISHVPGGAAIETSEDETPSHRDMLITLQDKNFWLFIVSLGLVTLGSTPMFSFLPLFMKQEVGLSESAIVLLQNGTLLGALLATLLVGWSADRYGSKPVMLSGLTLMLALPIIWLLIPKHSTLSMPIAFVAAMLQGIATLTWGIGFGKLLFVDVVPSAHKAPYMAVYYATIGVIGGVSQLLGGFILDFSAGFSGEFLSITLNPFTPIFILGLFSLIISRIMFYFVRSDTTVSTGQFASMFIRGNPMRAFESMFRYYRAKDERTAVAMTERIAESHSPLTVDELLDALIDPRFNVRFEALISITRTTPDPRFTEALIEKLQGTELALSGVSAWALGRIGDTRAREALRQGLDSDYRSIQAQCARSLGTLGDETIAPLILERLMSETDKGLQMAYASTLGHLAVRDATNGLLELLADTNNEAAKMEISLSLVRIIGEEYHFISLLRQIRREPGTTVAQALDSINRRPAFLEISFEECIDLWAHENLDSGSMALVDIIRQLSEDLFDKEQWLILKACALHLEASQYQHPVYLILALFILDQIDG